VTTIRRYLSKSGTIPRRTPLLTEKNIKPDWNLLKCPLDKWDKTRAFWQSTSALFAAGEVKLSMKNTIATVKHGLVMFWGCFAASDTGDLCTGNLCRPQWSLNTIKAFWWKMYCWASESSVSVAAHGFSNVITTQNIQLKALKNSWEQKRTVLNWPSLCYLTRNTLKLDSRPKHWRSATLIWRCSGKQRYLSTATPDLYQLLNSIHHSPMGLGNLTHLWSVKPKTNSFIDIDL